MPKEAETKPKKSKVAARVTSLINRFGRFLKIKETDPSNKTKNLKTESDIVQDVNPPNQTQKDASANDSIKNDLSSNGTKTKQREEHTLQKCDEVKIKPPKKLLESQNPSCFVKNKKVEAIVGAKLATSQIKPKNEVIDSGESENILYEPKNASLFANRIVKSEPVEEYDGELYSIETQDIQSESKNISLFANRIVKSEPVDEYGEESEFSFNARKNKYKDNDDSLKGSSNHRSITCLENTSAKDKETDEEDYTSESESDGETIYERGVDRISKNRESIRHREYQPRKRNQQTGANISLRPSASNATSQNGTSIAINNYVAFESNTREQDTRDLNFANYEFLYDINLSETNVDIQRYTVGKEIDKIIADIEIEKKDTDEPVLDEDSRRCIAKIQADEEITTFLNNLLGPNNNFAPIADPISNPNILSQELKTEARFRLFASENFSKETFFGLCLEMLTRIQKQEFVSDDHKVIHLLKPYGRKKYKRTNLQEAVMSENLEKTLCLVEIHKWYHNDLFEINSKDSSNPKKTALDWAYEIQNILLIDYLEENFAKKAITCPKRPINTPGA